jgi:hypothetical protein
MTISELIKTLERAQKHVGDIEVFINNDVLVPFDINSGRADVLLPEQLVDSEDFGRLFTSDQDILKLGS